LRPTHLMRPNAIPANAKASAPYLKFTATRTDGLGNWIADPAYRPAGPFSA
jgi:hypothetical protein